MRKIFTLLFALAASVGTLFAWDYERVQINDLYYNLDATLQTAEVTYKSYNSGTDIYNEDWDLVTANIPEDFTYNYLNYRVTSIGEHAFHGCSGLTSVTIPSEVTSIGGNTFAYCSNLTSVTWNAKNCPSEGFFGSQVESFTFGDEVETIPMYCCSDMTNLTSIEIPSIVTSIGEHAFYNCSGLTSVTIPSNVTSIGLDAFHRCTNLTSVTWNAKNCPNNGSFGDQVESFTFGNEVETIPLGCCFGMTNLTSIEIPSSVTSIGVAAFYDCSGLTSITIPANVTSIGEHAFLGCTSITDVYCYPKAADLTWDDGIGDFKDNMATICHVPASQLAGYQTKFDSTVDVTFVGDIPDYVNVIYQDSESNELETEVISLLHMPDAPEIQGFTFLKWVVIGGDLDDGIIIRAAYKSDAPTNAPVVTVPGKPAQKLIREGNVYVLYNDKLYNIQGQLVK